MDREQLEATFALQGWEPGLWMGRGAARKNDVVVEVYRIPPNGAKRGKRSARPSPPSNAWQRTRGWCLDDDEFAIVVPLIQAAEACQHETIGIGGAPMRCTECSQLVTR